VALVSAQQDIDIAYQDALDNIRLKRAKVDADELPPKGEVSEQKQKDVYVSALLDPLALAHTSMTGQFQDERKSPATGFNCY
jgi:hypothetical protein